MYKGFKLLAVRPTIGCDKKFLKNLKVNHIYNFYNDFQFKENNKRNVIEICNESTVPNDLFGENISVSAIVGKNGSGKSALIELFVASINQFSYYLNNIELEGKKQIITDAELESIEFVEESKGINSELFFLNNNQYFELSIVNNKFKSLRNISKKIEIEKEKLKSFFYTLIINYSIYSFNPHTLGNSISFKKSNNNWIDGLFHKNDSYQIPLVINPKRESANSKFGGVIDINNEQDLLQQRLLFNILKYYNNNYDAHLKITENRRAVKILIENKIFHNLTVFISVNDFGIKQESKIIDQNDIKLFWRGSVHNPLSNGIQIKDYIVHKKPKTYWDYDQILLKTLLKFRITKKRNPYIEKCYEYIVYKIFSICEKYPDYKVFLKDDKHINSRIRVDIDKFLLFISDVKNRSHITNKLLQVINFIRFYDDIWYQYADKKEFDILTLSKDLNNYVRKDRPLIELLPPPIFSIKIEVDEFLENVPQNNTITIDKLSSGEQQLIHTTSTVLYHLNNIKSVRNTGLIKKYDCTNLIFDEIELYFHPEYQRLLLKNIIQGLINNQLDTLKINILFVTHSPFILSDIPSQNILRLEDGKMIFDEVSENTFGANIHDLLANEFFLKNGFMGEFAKTEINKVIDFLNIQKLKFRVNELQLLIKNSNSKEDKNQYLNELTSKKIKLNNLEIFDSKFNKEYCKKIIELIGEPMLSSSLIELFTEAYPSEKNEYIDSQIARLEKLRQ
ncbi:AAA family ATPase [Chryseobacterium taiwanense]|nr:AAA family ATPase [Chryseobacterium taiwanense]